MPLMPLEELSRSLLPESSNSELLEPVPTTIMLSKTSTTTIISTLTYILANMKQSNIQHMLPRNHFLSLKWDKTKSYELTQYFRELEYLLYDC